MSLTPQHQQNVAEFVREGFTPRFGQLAGTFGTNRLWRLAKATGSELWLDTGNMTETGQLWTEELTAVTTNNSLLNKEIQAGTYDELVPRAAKLLAPANFDDRQRLLELAFILNATHGLRLVEAFDAFVSVEEHTDLAHDVEAAVATAKRYHAICPERFVVKIPFTPAGLLATRRLSRDGIPVNHTLGFAARQNYVIARIGQPQFVNVFMGRLNQFAADNGLGDGRYVGERALMASQRVVRELRDAGQTPTRQIAASIRDDHQILHSLGCDVLTIPVIAAKKFLWPGFDEEKFLDYTGSDYEPTFADGADPAAAGLETLWDVDAALVACVDALEAEDLGAMSPEALVTFFHDHGCGDVLPRWSAEEIATSAAEGKIPTLANWGDALAAGRIGLDALMNLAGLNAFTADQKAMDDRVAGLL